MNPSRFTLFPSRWAALELWPGYLDDGLPSHSPIFVREVEPLKQGESLLRIAYREVWYAEGVQEKGGIWRIIRRTPGMAIGVRQDSSGGRTAIFSPMTRGWLIHQCKLHGLPDLKRLLDAGLTAEGALDEGFGERSLRP